VLTVAFGLGWALLVEGVAFSVAAEEVPLPKRIALALLLGLPFVALVVRRFATDAEDALFRRHARRVATLALVVGLPLLATGAIGSWMADPDPYGEARRALGHRPCGGVFGWLLGAQPRSSACLSEHERRWATFSAASSRVAPAVRGEVIEACGRFGAKDPTRALDCADALLVTRWHAVRERRDDFRNVALASALPLGIALLFAWRGRRV
jgi:hypothetical protein